MNVFKTLLLTALFLPVVLFAQTEIGINTGISAYEGDLSPSALGDKLSQVRSTFGVFVRADVNERFALRGYVQQSKIQGSDELRPNTVSRNLNFRSNILEFGILGEYYMLTSNGDFAPFVDFGVSVYHFNPEAEYNGRFVELQPLGTEGQGLDGFAPKYSLNRFAVPLGIGFRYNVSESVIFGLKASARLTFFDHLDDVSGRYVNYYELLEENGSLSAALADRTGEFAGTEPRDIPTGVIRGNSQYNDWFYTCTLTLGYRLGTGLFNKGTSKMNRCYEF